MSLNDLSPKEVRRLVDQLLAQKVTVDEAAFKLFTEVRAEGGKLRATLNPALSDLVQVATPNTDPA